MMPATAPSPSLPLAAPVAIGFGQARAGALREPGTAPATPDAHAPERAGAGGASAAADAHHREVDVVVVGGGQAGLSVGYFLARRGLRFIILDAHARIGDSWRQRWDSLRLFSPARYNGLAGMRFPAPPDHCPTKDEMADYLEAYAAHFALPVRSGVRVDSVSYDAHGYLVSAGAERYRAAHVVIAAASYQRPRVPAFATTLAPGIQQLHAGEYLRPAQLKPGSVLVVGAGNSGAEIALEAARSHRVWLAGRHPGHIPVKHGSTLALRLFVPFMFRLVFHRLLTVDTPFGRKARPGFLAHGTPLIRQRPIDLERAGVQRVARLAGVQQGQPMLDDGQVLAVDNIVWCTGYEPGLDWIKRPIFDAAGRPEQYRGVAANEPGLYFAGLAFQHSPSSAMIHGLARDARRVVDKIVERVHAAARH